MSNDGRFFWPFSCSLSYCWGFHRGSSDSIWVKWITFQVQKIVGGRQWPEVNLFYFSLTSHGSVDLHEVLWFETRVCDEGVIENLQTFLQVRWEFFSEAQVRGDGEATWWQDVRCFFWAGFKRSTNWLIVGLGPGGLDSWNPRKWKGLLLGCTPRIPNHRASNQQVTISWQKTFQPKILCFCYILVVYFKYLTSMRSDIFW